MLSRRKLVKLEHLQAALLGIGSTGKKDNLSKPETNLSITPEEDSTNKQEGRSIMLHLQYLNPATWAAQEQTKRTSTIQHILALITKTNS